MPELKEKITSQVNLERPPILDRIVSEKLSEQEKQEVVDDLLEKFEKQEIEEVKGGEVELSPRQKELIEEANRLVGKALENAGIEMKTRITPAMVHLVKTDLFEKLAAKRGLTNPKSVNALASVEDQAVLIAAKEYDEIGFLGRLIHETLHMNCFISFQTADMIEGVEDNSIIVDRRRGLRMRETRIAAGKKVAGPMLFNELDEAVVEKLTVDIIRNFDIKILPDLKNDFKKSEKLRKILIEYIRDTFKKKGGTMSEIELLELANSYAFFNWQATLLPEAADFLEKYEKSPGLLILEQAISFYSDERVGGDMPQFAYGAHRVMFEKLIGSIFEKNKDKFNSPRSVADFFIKASFEGRLLPLARVIENTFGKGSFRKLGEGIDITS